MVRRAQLPTVITHNYDPHFGAFRNICTLPDSEAEAFLDRIRANGHRTIKPNYLRRRRQVEDWLISERQHRLGRTPLERPIYFFLGNFADGQDPSRPRSHVLPLATFPAQALTFTFPDSMASLPLATLPDHRQDRRDYHGRVFTLAEVEEVVREHGMPGQSSASVALAPQDKFIEVQVWDDEPIRRWLVPTVVGSAGT